MILDFAKSIFYELKNNDAMFGRFFVITLFFIGLNECAMQYVRWDFSRVPGDIWDTRLNHYFLEHGFQSFFSDKASFWSPRFFYPQENVLLYSVNHFGSIPIYSFFRFFVDKYHSFQLWFLFGIILNFFSANYVLKKLNSGSFASSLGAYFYTFSMPILASFGHIQLLYRFSFVFAIFFLVEYLRTQQRLKIFLSFFFIMLQFLFSFYLGYFTLLICFTVFLVYFFVNGKKTLSINKLKDLLFAMPIMTPAIILLYPYAKFSSTRGERSITEVLGYLPTLRSYFFSYDRSDYWSWLFNENTFSKVYSEHFLFLGGTGVLIFMISIYYFFRYWKSISIINKVFFIAPLLILLLTLNFSGYSFYTLLMNLPGVKAFRAVSRIQLLQVFFVSYFIVYFVNKLKKSRAFVFIIALLVVFDQKSFRHRQNLSELKKHDNLIRIQNPDIELKSNLLVYSKVTSPLVDVLTNINVMMFAQDNNLNTINGYSGNQPHWWRGHPQTKEEAIELLKRIDKAKKTNLLDNTTIVEMKL